MKIVVVEDEIRIREGLSKLLHRIDEEYVVVGEAANGQEGLKIIENTQPDLIISDVRMPDMDGLTMIKIIRDRKIDVEIILLSAYSEFDYARQAILLRVQDYLLKPINVSDLKRTLHKIEIRLKNKRLSHIPVAFQSLDNFMYQLLFSDIQETEELSSFLQNRFQISFQTPGSAIMLYFGNRYHKLKDQFKKRLAFYLEKRYGEHFCIMEISQTKSIVLALFDEKTEILNDKEWFETLLKERFLTKNTDELCAAWAPFSYLLDFKEQVNLIKKHLDYNLSWRKDFILSFPQILTVPVTPVAYPLIIEKQLHEAVCSQDKRQIEKNIEQFLNFFRQEVAFSVYDIKQAMSRFIWAILEIVKEVQFDLYSHLNYQQYLNEISEAITWTEIRAVFIKLFDEITSPVSFSQQLGLIVQKAQNIVREYYCQDLTLEKAAVLLNITPQYLSMQFKRETGTNFNVYLTEYRIQKSKQLLLGTNMKLSDIADKVGYHDSKYFSNVFKKYVGEGPKEYRKSH